MTQGRAQGYSTCSYIDKVTTTTTANAIMHMEINGEVNLREHVKNIVLLGISHCPIRDCVTVLALECCTMTVDLL